MSLLNDALRKRQNEKRPPQPLEAATLFKSAPGRHIKMRRRAAGIVIALLAVAATGIWTWGQWSDADQTAPHASAGAATEQSPLVAAPAQDTPTPGPIPTPAAASQEPAAAAVPAVRMPEATPESALPRVSPPLSQQAQTRAKPARAPNADRVAAPQAAALPARRITAAPLYEKARRFQRQGRTAEALAMYREVLKIEPNHFEARLSLSSIYLETDQFTQAHALAVDLLHQAPHNPQVVLNLAIAQIGCGRPAEALTLLDGAATLPQPPLYAIYFHKGVALRQLGRTEAAIDWYRKAEPLNPSDPRLLFNLALAFDQNQAYGQAVTYYAKYLNAVGPELDAAGRSQVQARVRALQAELAATSNGASTP